MKIDEIKSLVDRWNLMLDKGGRLLARLRKAPPEEVLETIRSNKADIIAYLKAEKEKKEAAEKAANELYRKREAAFHAIPGVNEILDVRKKIADDQEAFERAWRSGSGIYPKKSGVTTSDLKALEEKYPVAKFAIEVSGYINRANSEIYAMEKRAYEALCDGVPFEEVKAAYEQEDKDFVMRHAWD